MLVLARKRGESIMIGEEVRIVVLEIRKHAVRLGIEGPKQIPVHRNEVYQAIQKSMTERHLAANRENST